MQAESDFKADPAPPEKEENSSPDASDVVADTDAVAETEAVDDTDAADDAEAADDGETTGDTAATEPPAEEGGRFSGTRLLAHGVLPVLALLLALSAGYFKWVAGSVQASRTAAAESVKVASDSTVAILSYGSDSVDRDLAAATDRLTGGFREQYKQLVGDVVAPGAKQQHITAVAKVPAAASVSATEDHAVVLVFVDQTTTIGNDAPTQTTSSVRITLDKVRGHWLISQFDPV